MQCATFEDARILENKGFASTTDFLIFIGHFGWSSGPLLDEINRDSWHVIAADSQTMLEEITPLKTHLHLLLFPNREILVCTLQVHQ